MVVVDRPSDWVTFSATLAGTLALLAATLILNNICDKYIRPAMEQAGWNGLDQIYRGLFSPGMVPRFFDLFAFNKGPKEPFLNGTS